MKLTDNFSLDEMTASQYADRRGINNDPDEKTLAALMRTAQGLEWVRAVLGGAPINISSGYRSPAVNKGVGGSKNSQHRKGEAADFTARSFGTPREIVEALIDSDVSFDQLILEHDRWVHISFADRARRQALIIDRAGARPSV